MLNEIDFHISDNDKIGLVGKNGAGKSTVLKLICGLQNPTSGKVAVPAGVKIGYLPQIMEHHKGRTVIEETMTAFSELFDEEAELEKITVELAERQDYESQEYHDLIVRMNEINDRLSLRRSDNPQVQAERTLSGLGFKYEEFSRPTETFSQGWNMRIELAKILLTKPDLLLLDEPTSYLDVAQQLRLMDLAKNLAKAGKAVVLVLHDLTQALQIADQMVVLKNGRILSKGTPKSVYEDKSLEEAFEVKIEKLETARGETVWHYSRFS